MSFTLEKAIFINRAPFEHLELYFRDKGVNVLSAINGKGKTTILSHIADAFYELAKIHYKNEFEDSPNKFYRISHSNEIINNEHPSIVFFRFRNNEEILDYVDIRSHLSNNKIYSYLPDIHISYELINNVLNDNGFVKGWSQNARKKYIRKIFEENILTYFPSYRYEQPSFLTSTYKVKASFGLGIKNKGYLPNPIEVISGLPQLANWIMEVVLDWMIDKQIKSIQLPNGEIFESDITPEYILFKDLNNILSSALSSKKYNGEIHFGIGPRSKYGRLLAVVCDTDKERNKAIIPSIFDLSSGESALLTLFGEIIRQWDNLSRNRAMLYMTGIVLIDEVDKHLHITLQKEILPKLFELFPNIQFIVSSHSPFFNMGLADIGMEHSQIIDLDNNGIVCSPTSNHLYNEVYNMMINENQRYANKYSELVSKIKSNNRPIVITEGKTDYRHIRNAIKVLGKTDVDIDFYEVPDGWGDSKLQSMLENLSKIKQRNIVIGIFDRDTKKYLDYFDVDHQKYKSFENSNVYAFAIPLVNKDVYGESISIEHYYRKEDLLKEEMNTGRRLFLGSEFYPSGNSIDGKYQTKISQIQHKVEVNGIIDEKVFLSNDLQQKTNIALSKNSFTELIELNGEYSKDFNFDNFNLIINMIQEIINQPLH